MRVLLAALSLTWAATFAVAQDIGVPRSQILTIDLSRLFPETRLGQAILADMQEEFREFETENTRVAAAFRTEELALTEQRQTLSREEFAALAADFDARVRATREERDAIEAELTARSASLEAEFLQRVNPVLSQLIAEAGAGILIEKGTVLWSIDAIDVTDAAIARINQATRISPDRDGSEPPTAEEDDGAGQDNQP
ncbi:MAG: OmpH family outer membrane protein [Pseudomonadota bacterium]